jgi:hypothetical protein
MKITRRTMLRGTGAAFALPLLDAMTPAFAQEKAKPTRLVWVYVPHGMPMNMPKPNLGGLSHLWTPRTAGADYAMTPILEPLAAHRREFLVLTGLAHSRKEIPDDTNRHSQEVAIFLTGHPPKRTAAPDVGGPSIDQVAAGKLGSLTRFPSMELGTTQGDAGANRFGYSGAYDNNISWRSASIPTGKEIHPLLVFERLFGRRGAGEADRRSVLDAVMEDARSLRSSLGVDDRRKLDEYLEGVRGIETRIASAAKYGDPSVGASPDLPDVRYSDLDEKQKQQTGAYKGVPADYDEHVRLMIDLLVLTLRTDSTRVATLMLSHPQAPESRQYSRRHVDIKGAWHDHAHKAFEPGGHASMEEMVKVSRYHSAVFGGLLEKMMSVQDGDGTLLDHSMVLYGAGLGNGGTHFLYDLPVLLAGRGGGLRPGRHVDYDWKKRTPMCNLYVEMLQRAGIPLERFGVSDGRVSDLS